MSKFRIPNWILRYSFLLAALFLIAPSGAAQVTTGALQGVVQDQNKAAVAGATVKVTNDATGISRETTTNEEGFYRVTNLVPGDRYSIEVSVQGFSPAKLDNVAVRLATENSADITLTVGEVGGGTVVVTDEQPLIETTQSQLSTSYSSQQLTQLPFNGLIDNIALLTPGIVTPGDTDFTNGVGISANGNRGRSNNFQIDGQDNNDLSIGGPSTFISNAEAIGEFQVVTNSFSAEFGRNSGAQINTITKSGTNEFHGTLFEYHQNSALNAPDNIEKKTGASFDFLTRSGFSEFSGFAAREGRDPFLNNRFGGSIGGPIKKNKAFFFATYQGDIQRGETTVQNMASATVTPTRESIAFIANRFVNPATAQLAMTSLGGGPAVVNYGSFLIAPPTIDTDGDSIPDTFQFGPGNPFGQPTTPGFLAPLAVTTDGAGLRTIFGGEAVRLVPNNNALHQLITRVDFNLTDKDTLQARYIYDNQDFPNVISRILAGAPIGVPSTTNNLGVTYTRTLSPRFVNEVRFNFSRLNVSFGDPQGQNLPDLAFSTSGQPDLFFNFGLNFGTDTASFPQSRKVKVYQIQDTMSGTMGNHALKFGFDIKRNASDDFFLPDFLGSYTFFGSTNNPAVAGTVPAGTFFEFDGTPRDGLPATAFENFLLNRPRDIDFAVGAAARSIVQNDFFFFFQDDWRVRSNLTLNLGVRYEISTQPLNPLIDDLRARETDPNTALFDPSFPLSSRTTNNLPLDKNNIAPRVGFAWQPNIKFLGDYFSNGRTVIRGGFGIAYDPGFFNIVNNAVQGAPFAGVGRVRQTPGSPGALQFPFLPNTRAQLNGTPGTLGGNPLLFDQIRVSPNFYNPYAMSYNFGIQQELFKNTVFEARYVGTRIIGQFQTVNANPRIDFLNAAGVAVSGNAGQFTNGAIAGPPNAASNGNGRLLPGQGFTFMVTNGASSTYNGLQMRLDSRFTDDLTLNANYTLSKTLDNTSEIFSTLGGGQTISIAQNPFDLNDGERGLSAFHQKHNFTASFLYELPFYKEQRGWSGKLLGGYQLNGIIRMGSGRPYTPAELFGRYDARFPSLRPFYGNPNAPEGTIAYGSFAATNLLGDTTAAPGNFVLYNTLNPGSPGVEVTAAQALQQSRLIYNDFGSVAVFNTTAVLPLLEAFNLFNSPYGDVGRSTFSGLPFYNVNMSVFKTTNITENTKLEFRVEAFNLLNRRNFGVPDPVTEDAFVGFTVNSFQNPGFNRGASRTLRLGVRYIF